MVDVRALLKNERDARRINHPHATYSTTGALICLVCNLRIKSESLWPGHQRSPNHVKKVKEAQFGSKDEKERGSAATPQDQSDVQSIPTANEPIQNRKRRASDSENEGPSQSTNKRSKPLSGFLPEGFFDKDAAPVPAPTTPPAKPTATPPLQTGEFALPSRPLTPATTKITSTPTETDVTVILKSVAAPPTSTAAVDEDEWAAFEADIAAAEQEVIPKEAVILAAPLTAEEIEAKSKEEEALRRRERVEAEKEGDKEDMERKLIEEFEEMESLEERVRRLKERREDLARKAKEKAGSMAVEADVPSNVQPVEGGTEADEDDSELDDDDEDWLRG